MSPVDQLNKQLSDQHFTQEPAIAVGSTMTLLSTAIFVIIKFAFPRIPDDVLNAIILVGFVLIPIVTSLFIRKRVWSPASAQRLSEDAVVLALKTTEVLKNKQLKFISTEKPETPKPEGYKKY